MGTARSIYQESYTRVGLMHKRRLLNGSESQLMPMCDCALNTMSFSWT
jgi:hypothetical protein